MPRIITVTRKLEFDAGHRLVNHEGKCANLHGHRYVAELTVHAPSLDPLGRVIDFSCLKDVVGAWINEMWDHNMILHKDDPLLALMYEAGSEAWDACFGRKHPYIMQCNPTAENMADELYLHAQEMLHREVGAYLTVEGVRLWETPNCFADCKRI